MSKNTCFFCVFACVALVLAHYHVPLRLFWEYFSTMYLCLIDSKQIFTEVVVNSGVTYS